MDKFTWGVAGGTVLLVVAGIAAVVILQSRAAPPDLTTPEGVVRAYVEAIETGRPEDAWPLLSAQVQRQNPRADFVNRVGRYHRERQSRVMIEETRIEGSTARVDLARTYRSNGGLFDLFEPSSYANRSTVRLELESGQWRLSVPPDDYLLVRQPPPTVVASTPTPIPSPTRVPQAA